MNRSLLMRILMVIILALVGYHFVTKTDGNTKESDPENKGDDFAAIRSLPYGSVSIVPTTERHKSGVMYHNKDAAAVGLNLPSFRDRTEVSLFDNQGNPIHTWRFPLEDTTPWQHSYLCPNGDLLVMAKDTYLARLDWHSQLKWIIHDRFHHEIMLDQEGNIYALLNGERMVSSPAGDFPVLDDIIVLISPDGQIYERTPIWPIFGDQVPTNLLAEVEEWTRARAKEGGLTDLADLKIKADTRPDLFHTNSVLALPRPIAGLAKQGDLLISIRQLNTVAILDRESKQIIWQWGPDHLSRQHHATPMLDGNILIFDNGKKQRRSRALEVNPVSNSISWSYGDQDDQKFFSHWGGSAARLENGNTLLAVTDKGRAIEVSADGQIVWDYYTENDPPEEGQPRRRKRPTLYRIQRLSPSYLSQVADSLPASDQSTLREWLSQAS